LALSRIVMIFCALLETIWLKLYICTKQLCFYFLSGVYQHSNSHSACSHSTCSFTLLCWGLCPRLRRSGHRATKPPRRHRFSSLIGINLVSKQPPAYLILYPQRASTHRLPAIIVEAIREDSVKVEMLYLPAAFCPLSSFDWPSCRYSKQLAALPVYGSASILTLPMPEFFPIWTGIFG